MLDLNHSLLIKPLLERFLGKNGFTSSKRNLILNPNNPSGGVVEDGSTMVPVIISLSTVAF